MADEKRNSEQGEVDEPQEIAAEDATGAQEQPTERQQEREQEIVEEPVAESEQRAAEAAAPAGPEASPADETAPAEPPSEAEPAQPQAEAASEEPAAEAEAPEAPTPAAEAASEEPAAEAAAEEPAAEEEDEGEEETTPRVKPEIPGADLEVDIVREGEEALMRGEYGEYEEGEEGEGAGETAEGEEDLPQPIAAAAIDLGAGARYRATGKRKTAIARVILKPGAGEYAINGRPLEQHFPRHTLQRQIRQALETVGLEERMDVVAKMHGGGVSAQADALRHGISRALVEADPNLRSELKRRGFLTRDARVKERKKAGLKKARKRPQFSKR
jgi:small subunit ribosomal protein S9